MIGPNKFWFHSFFGGHLAGNWLTPHLIQASTTQPSPIGNQLCPPTSARQLGLFASPVGSSSSIPLKRPPRPAARGCAAGGAGKLRRRDAAAICGCGLEGRGRRGGPHCRKWRMTEAAFCRETGAEGVESRPRCSQPGFHISAQFTADSLLTAFFFLLCNVSGIASQWFPWASLKKALGGEEAAPNWPRSRRRGRCLRVSHFNSAWAARSSRASVVPARCGWDSLPRRSV